MENPPDRQTARLETDMLVDFDDIEALKQARKWVKVKEEEARRKGMEDAADEAFLHWLTLATVVAALEGRGVIPLGDD